MLVSVASNVTKVYKIEISVVPLLTSEDPSRTVAAHSRINAAQHIVRITYVALLFFLCRMGGSVFFFNSMLHSVVH